jgi:hypothetical protein
MCGYMYGSMSIYMYGSMRSYFFIRVCPYTNGRSIYFNKKNQYAYKEVPHSMSVYFFVTELY